MEAFDVIFTPNSGDQKGEHYGFTLATQQGSKGWVFEKRMLTPPSMVDCKIELTIEAKNENIPLSGGVELATVKEITDALDVLATETEPLDIIGLDGVTRKVRIDRSGYKVVPVIHETNKEPEYQVLVTIWGLYYKQEDE